MFGDPKVTVLRRGLDQSYTLPTQTNLEQLINFKPINQYGYARKLYLSAPPITATTALGGGTIALAGGAQLPQARIISKFGLRFQNIGPIFDCSGLDLALLNWMRQGDIRVRGDIQNGFGVSGVPPATDQFPFNYPTKDNSLLGIVSGYTPYLNYNSGSSQLNACYFVEVPLTERLVFPNVVLGKKGNLTVLTDQMIEVGMLFMQNPTINLLPAIYVEPAYGNTMNSMVQVTGAATATFTNMLWNIESEYWDVAPNPADRPSAFQMSWVKQVTYQDVAVGSQGAVVKFSNGGMLLRLLVELYNDTTTSGTLMDATATGTPSQNFYEFRSGPNVIRMRESAQANAYRSLARYEGGVPGVIAIDFVEDGYMGSAIDTSKAANLQLAITGLPAACTRVRVVEERLLNVKPAVATAN